MRRISFARLAGAAIAVSAALAWPAAPTAAQTGSLTGSVVDATSGAPINGAQVSIEGTSLGGLSNAKGRFLILNVPTGPRTVRVTYLGYRTEEQAVTVTVGDPVQANFMLQVSAVTLDEVVVTGTAGAVEQRKLGQKIASLNLDNIQQDVPLEGFSQALEGRIPGVRSVGVAGGVGAGRELRIRGTSSFELGQRPVIYIDGVRMDTNATEWGSLAGATCCAFSGGAGEDRLSDLNPEEIDRVEVLKGAAAATLYGSDASGGVIQIFTKKGRSNSPPRFTFSTSLGFNRHRENFPTTLYPNFTGPDGFRAWDANETLIENGLINTYDITAQGGGQDVTYFIAGGLNYEEGSIKPNDQTRGNLRVNLNWAPNEKWTVGINSAYSRNSIYSLQSGNNWMSLLGNATIGSPKNATEETPYGEPWIPVNNIKQVETFSKASRWTGGLTATFAPSQSFTNRLTLGLDNVDDQKTRTLPFGFFYVYANEDGERNIGYRSARNFTFDYLGQVSFGLSDAIGSQLSFGAQGFWETSETSMATGREFAGPGVTTVGGAAITFGDEQFNETVNLGVFAQNRFEIGDKLFMTAGVRVDGNSSFGENYGAQFYPKFDLAYNMNSTDDAWLPDALSSLKLRAAWGQAGRAPGAFDQFRTYDPTAVLGDIPGVTPANPGNPDLEPETTTEIEFGFDAGFFEDRLGTSFTFFDARTRDALLEIALPSSLGFQNAQLQNVGEIMNRGVEVTIDASPVVTPGFRWTTALNFDWTENEVLDLGPNAQDGLLDDEREGFPVEAIFAREVNGWDAEAGTHTRTDTAVYQGHPLPNWSGGFSNTFQFGPMRLFAQLRGEWGATFANGDRPYRVRQQAGDEYLSTLDAAGNPTPVTDSLVNFFTLQSAYDSRDQIRLQEVSLSYQIPESMAGAIGLGRTQVTLSGYNLWWWDSCNCMDPSMQWAGGSSFNFDGFLATPQPRRFLFSIRTAF
jgi:TonB-dependent SusC/RagA subfamily outer membrane receptor